MNAKIALVEDEPDIRKMLRSFLEGKGCTVSEAADGHAAEKLLADEVFDLILMDLMLPGISGEQLIASLRRDSDTPVIVISAKSMLETRLAVLRLGADDYIAPDIPSGVFLCQGLTAVNCNFAVDCQTLCEHLSCQSLIYLHGRTNILFHNCLILFNYVIISFRFPIPLPIEGEGLEERVLFISGSSCRSRC